VIVLLHRNLEWGIQILGYIVLMEMLEKVKKLNKYLVLVIIILLHSCGGSSGDNDPLFTSGNGEKVGEEYDEKPGDEFTYIVTTDFEFSTGLSTKNSYVDVSTYSQLAEIPSKYNYSGSVSGPYLLETQVSDGELDRLVYNTLTGQELVNDSLDIYTSTDYSTRSGDEEEKEFRIDDHLSFTVNNTLFDSSTGEEIGYEITEEVFDVLLVETITIPAGTFEAVKIKGKITETRSESGVEDVFTADGYLWYDINSGFDLKTEATGSGSLNILSKGLTATISINAELQSFSLAIKNKVEFTSPAFEKSGTSKGYNLLLIRSKFKNQIQKFKSKY